MLPMWLMIAQGVKQIADNQNEQANTQSNIQPVNNNTNSNAGNAFSTISSIYNNYLSDSDKDKKKDWFSQIFGNR